MSTSSTTGEVKQLLAAMTRYESWVDRLERDLERVRSQNAELKTKLRRECRRRKRK
jgi:hypothetical protein